MKSRQSGFTLVEIAIVLVIIGLLLGGVLKGQEMIENSKIKSVVNDMKNVSAAYNSYVDRYHAIPGDEALATMTARGWTVTLGGNANGALAAAVGTTFTNPAVEQAAMWQALRAGGLVAGDPALGIGAANLPRAGTGGLIGVAVAAYGQSASSPSVCVSNLTTKQMAGVDTALDGTPSNAVGSLRGATGAANLAPTAIAPALVAYNEAVTLTTWTACNLM
ncbi:MAG: prepilin-type N-terminal cleavage/methylation domain-containing protein [Sulfuricella sp.]|nr:prepilin-type N-terminal cleavage/methylation domain-containing protein [Sulfuricella sp.]